MARSLAVLFLVCAACQGSPEAGDDRATGSPAVTRPVRQTVLFVGTSLTAGLGIAPEDAFPALIQQKIDSAGLAYRVVNAGVSGASSAEGLARISWLLRQPVDVLVLELGANDGLRGTSVEAMERNLQAIVDSARAHNVAVRLVVVGMEALPNLGRRYTEQFRQAFRDVASRNGAALIPFLLEGVAAEDSLNQGDGIHPTEAGHRIVAENVWRVLEGVLRTRE